MSASVYGAGVLLAAALAVPAAASGPPAGTLAPAVSGAALEEWARTAAAGSWPEFLELLTLPNDQAVAADIQRNADWLEAAFRRRGLVSRQLPNEGRPMVFAETPGASGERKTVLFYAHFDGQPVTPAEWKQESPWKPVLKRRIPGGGWEAIPLEHLRDADPDWRLFGRSTSDDKGPIAMLLAALDALRAHGVTPSVNVRVILDSQEEEGSPSITRVVTENLEALRSDAVVIMDGPRHESNRPTIVYGNRGIVAATLRVFGARGELHSGHYGNYVPNPAQRLAALLASMKDESGRVTIPGFYDGIVLDEATRRVLAAVPDDEAALRKRLGIATSDRVGATYQESLQYPSLNVRGFLSADVGAKARTVVPESAVAEIDLRTVPETPPGRLQALLEKHVVSQGWHLVAGSPTDEERAKYPKLAALEFRDTATQGTASRTALDAPVGKWLAAAMTRSFGKEPIRIRIMGGTTPTRALVEPLGAPFVILPLVNPDNAQHAADENLRVGNYVEGVKTLVAALTQPF